MSELPTWKGLDPAERKAILIQQSREGKTASQIAACFADFPSRNAIIGAIHRLHAAGVAIKLGRGQVPTSKPAAAKKAKATDPHVVPERRAKPQRETADQVPQAALVPSVPQTQANLPAVIELPRGDDAFLPLPDTTPIGPDDLQGGRCHWLVNGRFGREPIYCGEPADGAFCSVHHRIAYVPNSSLKEKRNGAHSGR